ncbi:MULTISPECIES: hypothetical protein [Nostoc]|uniref:Uncharacterized protein n=1 Tax=Nostoc paludosum FACHB-159 TaxID=2692908 RepID=A0ABR8KIN2_9NOSO|nr:MULTISPECIES: hypothetical protein [Nostoc]MBD2683086.1 hypothetical protein [Nostoc sp. FACHB-857]MBD2739429.1 hypothetical protein [Nostoc paludosum FACHB-159]
MLPLSIEKIAVSLFWSLANDEKTKKQVYNLGLKFFDSIQVATGNVNLHSPEEAVKIAISTCIRKDRENQARVAAFVTALYLQYEIERAAQIGGSLLNRFGKSWFPHIKDREIRFALKVDTELENYLYNQILNESY